MNYSISKNTGKTIRNDNERLCGLMQKTAEIMNLRPHLCGHTTLFSAADVEVFFPAKKQQGT